MLLLLRAVSFPAHSDTSVRLRLSIFISLSRLFWPPCCSVWHLPSFLYKKIYHLIRGRARRPTLSFKLLLCSSALLGLERKEQLPTRRSHYVSSWEKMRTMLIRRHHLRITRHVRFHEYEQKYFFKKLRIEIKCISRDWKCNLFRNQCVYILVYQQSIIPLN